uniref:F-box/kelch-repeat protein At3g06240-like n=1 Tax=Erigeron canadensis TaxID=72917 RepID=UPI001CB939FF|nr:F-box/kelch-repeat protein At3g06240-like [Erigeron canadensis]
MAEIAFDAMERILIRSDAEDLVRWKAVCKSWYSLIPTPYFTDSHLKHNNNYKNDKRLIGIRDIDYLMDNYLFIIGCANGLVCVAPQGFEFSVINPYTKQTMKILEPPPEPLPESDRRWNLVWGFGYDPSNNDYKIVVGLVTERQTTHFYVLSLKTFLWKFIEEISYAILDYNICGILCDGALHWLMSCWKTGEVVIISFNLSREEFTKTQPPPGVDDNDFKKLTCMGAIEESPCLIQSHWELPTKIWVLRSNSSGKQSWDLLPDNYVINCDAVCFMSDEDHSIYYTPSPGLEINTLDYIAAPIYVRSLVSPHVKLDSTSKSGSNDTTISMEEERACKEECSNKADDLDEDDSGLFSLFFGQSAGSVNRNAASSGVRGGGEMMSSKKGTQMEDQEEMEGGDR